MKKNSYEQFFNKAQQVKRADSPVARPTEQRLRQAVKMKRAKPPFPWKAVAGLAFSLLMVTGYLLRPDIFDSVLNHIEIRAMGQAEAADKEAAKPAAKSAENAQASTAKGEKPAADGKTAGSAKGAEDKAEVSGDLSQFEKLKQRKEELDAREKDLTELEEELQKQKLELDKRITQLEEMRNQIGQTLKDRVDVDQEKVNKLVDLYSNMKPKQAADVIGSLNEELAVEVLAKMKKKNAAEVMNLLSPEKARILSEKYTGYRRVSSQEPKG